MNLLRHKRLKCLKAVCNGRIEMKVAPLFFFPHIYMNQIEWRCIFQTNKQTCGQNAAFLPSTSITSKHTKGASFILTVEFMNHFMFCEKCAIIHSLGCFFCQVVWRACCSMKWFLVTNRKSCKVEHMAFVFYSNLTFSLCLIYITFHVRVCVALVRSMKYLMESPAYLATAT